MAALFLGALPGWGTQRHPGTGLVLKVNPERNELLVSMQEIPGYMDAMVMPLRVLEPQELNGVRPGAMVDFTLVVSDRSSYAENVRVRRFESLEKDPREACRLTILEKALAKTPSSKTTLAIGQRVPDFALTDQNRRRVALSQFAGKVVAMTFVYTRCPLPNFCFRLSNNFGQIQKRFGKQMGHELILLTVTLDPANDRPNALAKYASIWKANPVTWRFLTGPAAEVKKITGMFGVDYWPDEGMMTHSLHTVIIDRRGDLVANLEGNKFTTRQLGDFVAAVLNRAPDSSEPKTADLSHRRLLSQNSSRAQE